MKRYVVKYISATASKNKAKRMVQLIVRVPYRKQALKAECFLNEIDLNGRSFTVCKFILIHETKEGRCLGNQTSRYQADAISAVWTLNSYFLQELVNISANNSKTSRSNLTHNASEFYLLLHLSAHTKLWVSQGGMSAT